VVLPVGPYQKWLPTVFRSLDAVLPVSRATGAACSTRGASPEIIYVQPNGIQLNRFSSIQERDWLQNTLEVPTGSFFLISVGRQVKRKGSAWFVEHVLPLLPDSVQYVIVGTGPEDASILRAAERAGVSARVHPLGRVSEEDLPLALHSADLFVMPNVPVPGDMEGFGVVMLEAALCGLPTIAACLEGVADVVVDGQNGHLVDPLDAEGFASHIRAYVEDPASLRALSGRATAFTTDRFAWPAVADQMVQTLKAIERTK
jgi:phosphatidylinositol alpha-1,6-mannosyltransferase